jgi:hypothetical protein
VSDANVWMKPPLSTSWRRWAVEDSPPEGSPEETGEKAGGAVAAEAIASPPDLPYS